MKVTTCLSTRDPHLTLHVLFVSGVKKENHNSETMARYILVFSTSINPSAFQCFCCFSIICEKQMKQSYSSNFIYCYQLHLQEICQIQLRWKTSCVLFKINIFPSCVTLTRKTKFKRTSRGKKITKLLNKMSRLVFFTVQMNCNLHLQYDFKIL